MQKPGRLATLKAEGPACSPAPQSAALAVAPLRLCLRWQYQPPGKATTPTRTSNDTPARRHQCSGRQAWW